MAGVQRLRIKKYFGSASIQEMVFTLDEAKDFLAYFFTEDGGSNIMVAVGGQKIMSYDELVKVASQDCYKTNAYIDVGLYLTTEGRNHISS
jgi:hypothetical protein